ncbi:hypothetical protein CBFG_00900 [Clostridiales bacterium 1_7_47FAA]|nr:hypothetical protein CBFG_00900 [Clostridiales bacterium 1_7_47FAA]
MSFKTTLQEKDKKVIVPKDQKIPGSFVCVGPKAWPVFLCGPHLKRTGEKQYDSGMIQR